MQTSIALLSLAAAAYAAPQAVGGADTAPAPAGCSPDYSGNFGITAVNITMSGSKSKRQDTGSGGATGPLSITLSKGVLTDSEGRIGDIVANHQFQFDPKPGQAGAIYTGGFSACNNGSLALGSSAVFYSCVGINQGGFFNLYNTPAGNMCNPVLLMITPLSGSSSGSTATSAAASQKGDGQPVATTVASQKTDGQVVAPTAVSQKTDGQIVAPTAVSQKSDGQIVAPTAVIQKSDGQVIAPTAMPMVSVKSDGQIIVATVMQKSDGQIIATGAPVAQKSDGQIVASSAPTGAPVAQKTDGQIVASTGAPKPTSTGLQVTSSASTSFVSQLVAAFAGVVAVAFL